MTDLRIAAQAVITARDDYGWSTEADDAINALRAVLARPVLKPSDGAIDALCAPGRAQRWKGDGRQYDRDTARLVLEAFATPPAASTQGDQPAREAAEHWMLKAHELQAERDELQRRLEARALFEHALATPSEPGDQPATHRHIKRGTTYTEIGRGKLQADTPHTDMSDLVAYRGEDGALWFRCPTEFDDPSRFERLAVPSEPAQPAAPDAYPALQALTEAILRRADRDYLCRQLDAAVAIMASRGWLPPVPWPDEGFGISVWGRIVPASRDEPALNDALPPLPEPWSAASTIKCTACGAPYAPMRPSAINAAGAAWMSQVPPHAYKLAAPPSAQQQAPAPSDHELDCWITTAGGRWAFGRRGADYWVFSPDDLRTFIRSIVAPKKDPQ